MEVLTFSTESANIGHSRRPALQKFTASADIKITATVPVSALNGDGSDESRFLDPLLEIAESGQTAAERKLELFHGEWNGDIDRVFREFAY